MEGDGGEVADKEVIFVMDSTVIKITIIKSKYLLILMRPFPKQNISSESLQCFMSFDPSKRETKVLASRILLNPVNKGF